MSTNSNFASAHARQHAVVGAQPAALELARASTTRLLSAIQMLPPKVSESAALKKFSTPDPASILRTIRLGPLQRIAQVYVPFHLYRVPYTLGREHLSRLFAIDAVEGSLDLFEFPAVPDHNELVQVETRNALPTNLSDDAVQELLREKVLRIVFQQGFFKLRDANISFELVPLKLHIPYWLGFYGRKNLHCRVLDATRSKFEGAKASALFETWLSA